MKLHKTNKKKNLKRGYTTGACCQAAARAAAMTASTGYVPCEHASDGEPAGEPEESGSIEVTLPNGETTSFSVTMHAEGVCSVVKDAGDDPDITDGIRVIVCVEPRLDGRVSVDGAEGVGRATLKGLPLRPGRAAINPVPLRHVRAEVKKVLSRGADVTISIPEGEKLAKRTFNPRIGIVGGLSILGTTGRVEPWSSAAYQESLLPQLDIARAAGVKIPVLVPGAKGERAAKKSGFDPGAVALAGNFFGMMLAAARDRGFKRVALVGHAAKLAKMARGDFDTHSRRSGPPLDVLAESAETVGISRRRAAALRKLPTTEEAIRRLRRTGDLEVLDVTARRSAAAVKDRFGLKADVFLTDASGQIVGGSHG